VGGDLGRGPSLGVAIAHRAVVEVERAGGAAHDHVHAPEAAVGRVVDEGHRAGPGFEDRVLDGLAVFIHLDAVAAAGAAHIQGKRAGIAFGLPSRVAAGIVLRRCFQAATAATTTGA